MTHPGVEVRQSGVLSPLKRIDGQAQDISKMIEDDHHYVDVHQQKSTITRALQGFALHLLDGNPRHSVAEVVNAGGDVNEMKLHETGNATTRPLWS